MASKEFQSLCALPVYLGVAKNTLSWEFGSSPQPLKSWFYLLSLKEERALSLSGRSLHLIQKWQEVSSICAPRKFGQILFHMQEIVPKLKAPLQN